MFGFLRVQKRDLDDEARADYRAHFCAACHALRAVGGRSASLLTNYDQTFLALVVASLDDRRRDAPVVRVPCTAMPLRRVTVQPLAPGDRRFLAHATLALVGAKLDDDVADGEGTGRRVARRILRRRFRRAHAALAREGFPLAAIADLPTRQATAERESEPDVALLTAPTVAALSALFVHAAHRCGRPDLAPALSDAASALARVIYLFDAWEDRKRDRARGRFNAIDALVRAGVHDGHDEAWTVGELRRTIETDIDTLATALLTLPDGPQRPVLTGVVATLRTRAAGLSASPPNGAPTARRLATQRGDCDCGGCDCCCDFDGPDCCSSLHCFPGDCCWCGSNREEGGRRRVRRRSERGTERGDEAVVEAEA